MKTLLVLLAIRVLCVGNSFSADAMEQELIPMCTEAGVDVEVHNLYVGGCSLEKHTRFLLNNDTSYAHRVCTNANPREVRGKISLREALQDGRYDYISLQQVSHLSGVRATYDPWLRMLMDTIKAYQPYAQLCWMQTWAYSKDATHFGFPHYQNDQQLMYDSIVSCVRYVMSSSAYPLLLVPCGEAVQLGRQTSLGDTFCRDGYHLKYSYGRYIASAVWFEILTGKNVRHLRYRNPKMSLKERNLVQKAAHQAVKKVKNKVF